MKYVLERWEEHPRTGYTDYRVAEGTLEDIVEWCFAQEQVKGRLRLSTIAHKGEKLLLNNFIPSRTTNLYLILDPPEDV